MNALWIYLTDFQLGTENETDEIPGTVYWVVSDDEGELSATQCCTLPELRKVIDEELEDPEFEAINLFIDDILTLFVRREVPGRSTAQIRRALPFAVEDYLSDELEEVHIATGPISRYKPVECVAIQKEILRSIIDVLEEQCLAPTYCSTIGLHTPIDEDLEQIQIVFGESLVWVRTTEQIAAIEHDIVAEVIDSTLVTQTEETEAIVHVFSDHRVDVPSLSSKISEVNTHDVSLLEWIVENFEEVNGIDLLQGEFINQAIHSSLNTKKLQLTGIFASLIGIGYLVLLMAEGVWADVQANRMEHQMIQIYETIYDTQPNPNRNIATQMRNKMGVGSNVSQQFNYLLGQLASVVASPAHAVELNSLRFQSSLQSLSTEFEIPSLDDLDDFKAALENEFINVRINEAERVESVKKTRANLTMSLIQ